MHNESEKNIKKRRKCTIIQKYCAFLFTIERLDEYNNSFVHAYVFKHNVELMDLDRRMIEPTINFNEECVITR